jgi:hypothetical protein
MKRFVIVAACLVLASACSKKSSEPAAVASGAQPATAAAGTPAAAPAADAAAAEPKKVEITEDLVQKYIEYQKENFALLAKYAEETRKNLADAKGDTAKTLQQIQINDKLAREMDEKLRAKRASLGISDDQFEAVKDAAGIIATGRMTFTQMGGDVQMAKMEAEQKAQIAKLPADQKSAAEAEMAKMSQSMKDMRDGAEARQKYGDKAGDALLKYADVLAKMQYDAMKGMAGK